MGACAAAGFDYVELGSVGVAFKYNFSGAVGDAVVRVSGKVIEELEHAPVYVFCG